MHKGEIFKMLFMEQFFSGVCAVFAGIGIGKMTSAMFVPMLQRTYAAANQILPMRIISDAGDQMRLYGGNFICDVNMPCGVDCACISSEYHKSTETWGGIRMEEA